MARDWCWMTADCRRKVAKWNDRKDPNNLEDDKYEYCQRTGKLDDKDNKLKNGWKVSKE